jgi:hypothetical protein
MSALKARGEAILPFTPSADQTGKEGYLTDLAGDTATVSSSATTPAKGVILDGAAAGGKSSIGILGALSGTVRVRAGGAITKGAEIQQGSDGRVVTDAGTGARVIVGVALEDAVEGQIIEAALRTPVARS